MAKALNIGFAKSLIYSASAALLIALTGIASPIKPVQAQSIESDWWFDVEFIAFKRDLLPGHPEDFTQSDFEFADGLAFDLFTLELLKQENPTFRLLANLGPCEKTGPLDVLQNLPLASDQAKMLIADAQSFIDIALATNTEDTQEAIDVTVIEDPILTAFIEAQTWTKDSIDGIPPILCKDNPEYDNIQAVPEDFFAQHPYTVGRHSLLKKDARYLNSYAKRVFSQRDISPIIYTAWRQPVVFGEDNAAFYKVFGGQNIVIEPQKPDFSSDDESANISEEEFISMTLKQLNALEQALAEPSPVEWENEEATQDLNEDNGDAEKPQSELSWELDGLFKVYLEYVNRVPYLHIDSQFKHTRVDIDADGQAQLEVFGSKQRRRVISKQIHYFDHPAFGIIVRLERYEVPPAESQTDSELSQ